MANTENIEAKLCAYVDGELDPAGRAEIEAHLETNPQHRQLMTQLMQQRDLLSGLPRERAPEDLFESMQNQLERAVLLDGDAAPGGAAGGSPHIAGRINRWPQRFAAAAVLLLAVGLAAVIYFVLPNQKPPDYARLPSASTGSSAPMARSAEASRRLDDLGAATSPTALAHADADRMESKVGAMKAETIVPDRTAGGAMTQPTAIAAGPTPPLPAAPPAAAAAAPADIFTKNAGNQSKSSDLAAASTMTNVFADAQINETLKDAPGVPDNSMLVVVNAGNPSATNEQIRAYFDNNGIKWEPAAEPMPEPLELRQSQTVMRSRLGNTQMKLKGGGNNDHMEGQTGFGGQSAAAPPPTTPPPSAVDDQKNLEIASAQEATRSDRKLDAAAAQVDKNFEERSKVAEPSSPAPPPAATDGAPSAGDAVAMNAQKQMPGGSNASGSATGGAGASTGAGAATAAPQLNGQYAGKAGGAGAGSTGSTSGIVVGGKKEDSRETAKDDVQRQQPRDEVAQAASPPSSPNQPQAKSSESSVQSQSAAAAPAIEMEQQRQQGQQSQQQLAAQPPLQSQAQQQPQSAQSPQFRQVFIARGVTKQQVVAMNNAIANGNRINNYNRAGATITPTTLPSFDADGAGKLLLKEQSGIRDSYANKPAAGAAPGGISGGATGSIAGAGGAGGAAAPSTQPAAAPARPNGALAEEMKRAPVATPTTALADVAARRAATGPAATQPTTTETAAPAADERVDVVILVQPENENALQQYEQPAPNAVAPNSAATEPTAGPAPTSPSPAATSAPATAPVAQ